MFSYSKFDQVEPSYNFNSRQLLSSHYRVRINGEEVPVYTCRISRFPFNRGWNGVQRNSNQSELASYINLVSDEELSVEVETTLSYNRIMLKPYSKGVKTSVEDGKIKFTLRENGYFVLELDSYHHCLYIFNKKEVLCEDKQAVKYYFGPGIHFPGKMILQSGDKVYLDKDALVYGSIFAENAENIHLYGNGIFDDGMEERVNGSALGVVAPGNMQFIHCKNVKIQGVGMQNSAHWCLRLFHCFDVEMDGIQIFGQWKYNTDGIDICNCQNISIKNSLIHAFDDGIVIKGIDEFALTDNVNITAENCVLWCDWGKTLEIGIESSCRENRDIVFRNIDILRAGNTACDIQNGDIAENHHILFENINVEYNSFDTPEVFQVDDDQTYSTEKIRIDGIPCGVGNVAIPKILNVVNHPYHENEWVNLPFVKESLVLLEEDLPNRRLNHHITLKNIHIYYDEGIPIVEGKYNAPIFIKETYEGAHYHDIVIDGLYINGEKITKDTAYLLVETENDCLTIK